LKLGLLDDGFAQFPRFLEDHVLSLNICFHKYESIWQHSLRHASPKFDLYFQR
jgi:hypothetical protein